MEKMQLGSPASGSPAQNTYLPNFLMGVENTPTNRSFCKSQFDSLLHAQYSNLNLLLL